MDLPATSASLDLTQFDGRKTTQLITAVCLSITLLQIPLLLFSGEQTSSQQIALILVHGICFVSVLILNESARFQRAKLALVFSFSSYIFSSDMNYQHATDMHYFYLLGLFAVPILFLNQNRILVVILMLWFLILYCFPAASFESVGALSSLEYQLQTNHLFFAMAAFLVAYYLYQCLHENWQQLNQQTQQYSRLLENILPKPVAKRLTTSNDTIADSCEQCTVIFADIAGFTNLGQQLSARTLVKMLNELFSAFDALTKQFGLEKIKTIGDQYMAVCGAPVVRQNHAIQTCDFACAMQKAFNKWRDKHHLDVGLRIGIHSGPVIAGVIGSYKFSYDLWGHTVNYASRMESQGLVDEIQVSNQTYQLCQKDFCFLLRKTVLLKGIGIEDTYLLKSRML